ncbi:DEAD/DEAH box helicase [Bacillus sp. Marseille-P3661]|uniref:DEAD/DEAH box helicase n=1 Tax=Bacillus sp. Marseille-P3661 TaxID=1936234 RepID=UPI000C821506|nr:DEAD/DEAH box helicase [Bacillus sp. Marseille-P3661]
MNFLLNVAPFLKDAWEKAGFKEPTKIQDKTIPIINDGEDIIAESPTGTGKTLAYLLPLLNKIEPNTKQIQVVILTPTRELAMQIHQVIQTFTQNSEIVSGSFIGGVDIKRQIDRLKKNPQIIVGTPGRVMELIDKKKMKMHEVKTVVVDEVDQMVEQSLLTEVKVIIQSTLKERQVLFFSATISEKVEEVAKQVMVEPALVRVEREATANVEHLYFVCEQRDKIDLLRRIYKMNESMKALIFINDAVHIDRVADKFRYKKIPIGVLHSDAGKKERASAIQQFRAGTLPLILATDIAARGMDIQGLTHVIHLDVPEKIEQYIHRSGRTGRMGATGTVISLVTPSEEKSLLRFGRELNVTISKKELYKGEIIEQRPVPKKVSTQKPMSKQKPIKKSNDRNFEFGGPNKKPKAKY